MRYFAVCLLAGIAASLAGCGENKLAGEVSGKVTVDGQTPAAGSSISFVPVGESTAGDGGGMLAADGSYSTRLAPGKYKVEIRVPRPAAGAVPPASGPGSEGPGGGGLIEESLPAKYHDQTELTIDIQPGSNQKDWEVSTK